MSSYEHIGPDSDDEEIFTPLQCRRTGGLLTVRNRMQDCLKTTGQTFCSRHFLKAFVLGQIVSVFLCGTSVFSELLQNEGVHAPTAQSFLNYVLLCMVFTVMLACRHEAGERHLGIILRSDWWKYIFLALIDVEANYLVVKAYSYTTITSVQLLNCSSIVVVMILSYWFLKTRYKYSHLIGVGVSIAGLGGLIAADVFSGRSDNTTGSNKVLGDILVIVGAVLYGVSNVGQEFVVKNYPRSEYLGMIGLFGSFISGIQFIALERNEVAHLNLSFKIWGPWFAFVVCLFSFYVCMSLAIQKTSATTVNISIFSTNFYTLLIGLGVFHYQFHLLYIVAYVVVMMGLTIYATRPVGDGSHESETIPTEVSR